MHFIEKVASYYGTYQVSDNDEALLKTASEDGVSKDDLVAFHNLTQGNMFTGENLIQLEKEAEESDSRLIQFGFAVDDYVAGNLDDEGLMKVAYDMGLDEEDVQFVLGQVGIQMEEAGLIQKEASAGLDEELLDKVASAVQFLIENDINPELAFTIAANTDEEGYPVDEKTASLMGELGEEALDKIAEALDMVGGEVTPEVARAVIAVLNS